MIESKNDASRNLEKALQALEQAKQRVADEKKKKNEKKRRSTGFVCARQGQGAGAAGGLREAVRREGLQILFQCLSVLDSGVRRRPSGKRVKYPNGKGFSEAGKETHSMGEIKQGTEAFRGTGQQPSRDFLGNVEDDGRICAEAEEGRSCSETEHICNGTEQIKNYGEAVQGRSFGEDEQSKCCEETLVDGLFEEAAPSGTCENSAGWKRIPNLGRVERLIQRLAEELLRFQVG
jgi:hypothetical protein